jgi:hypothetical protein
VLIAAATATAALAVSPLTASVSAAAASPDLVVDGQLPADAAPSPSQTVELWLFSVRTPAQALAHADQQMTLVAKAPVRADGSYSIAVDLAQAPAGYVDPDGGVTGRLDVVGGAETYIGTVDALVTPIAKREAGGPVHVDADVVEIPVGPAKRTHCGTSICNGPYNACRQGEETPIWHDIRQYTTERMVDFQRVFTLAGTRQSVRMFNGHHVSTSVMASVPWATATLFSAGQQSVDEGSWSQTIPVAPQSNVMVKAGVELHWHELQCMQIHGDYYRDTGVAEYYPVRPTGSAFSKAVSEPWFDCSLGNVSTHAGNASLTVQRSTSHKTTQAFSVFGVLGLSGLDISDTRDTEDTSGVTLVVRGVRTGDQKFWLCGTNDYAVYAKSAREVVRP